MTPPHSITESETEEAALSILENLGHSILYGPDILRKIAAVNSTLPKHLLLSRSSSHQLSGT